MVEKPLPHIPRQELPTTLRKEAMVFDNKAMEIFSESRKTQYPQAQQHLLDACKLRVIAHLLSE